MTTETLASILRDMYKGASLDEQTETIHLFGIIYARELDKKGISVNEVVEKSGIKPSYHIEVRKGMRLSKYVETVKYKDILIKFPI